MVGEGGLDENGVKLFFSLVSEHPPVSLSDPASVPACWEALSAGTHKHRSSANCLDITAVLWETGAPFYQKKKLPKGF